MSRATISAAAKLAMQAAQTFAQTPTLLEIYSAEAAFATLVGADTIYFCNNTESITYSGHVYLPFPFSIQYPGETDDSITNARITISAVDQLVISAIRILVNSPTIRAHAMFFPNDGVGDFEEMVPWEYSLKAVTYDVNSVSGDLIYEDRLDNQMGPVRATAQNAPGLFG